MKNLPVADRVEITAAGTDRAPAYRTDEPAKPGAPGHCAEQLDCLPVFAWAKPDEPAGEKTCGPAQV